jgi:hypothetical protein
LLKLTLNMLTTTIVAPPSNASKWHTGFNSAFKGLTEGMHRIQLHFVWLSMFITQAKYSYIYFIVNSWSVSC